MNRNLRGTLLLIVLAAAFVLLIASREIMSFVVDWLFFREVRFEPVFLKTVTVNAATGLVFGITAFLVLFVNLRFAAAGRFSLAGLDQLRRSFPALERIDLDRILRRAVLALSGFAFVVAFAAGYWKGPDALLFFSSVPAGTADPIFGRDLSFFLFSYPFLDSLNEGFRGLLVLSALLSALLYLFRGGLLIVGRSVSPAPRVKRHLGILAALFLASLSVHFFLGRYGLLMSEHGVLFGASYTDVHARLPILTALAALTAAAGIAVAITVFGRSVLVPLAVLGALAGLSILGLSVYPALVQSVQVSPNELVLERPYLKDHIDLTRYGYGLESVETQSFAADSSLQMADIRRNLPTIRNIRLWDEEPLLKTYSQLQQIRTYYRFDDVDNDRYRIGDKYVQVMLSPRELSYRDLPGKSWINERLVFTHGFGLAMGPVSGITKEGLPEFYIKDIPPVTSAGPEVTRPEIYYGEHPNDYVIVGTHQKEFGYPTTDKNVSTTYAGAGGVRLSSMAVRLLYAAYFGNFKIVLSEDITPESRILYNRSILDRVQAIAPFFSYDPDPYMVVRDDGRLSWIIDAYTTTGRLPYSKPVRPDVNYIRNPVKIVVDAYDGTVAFYVVDPTDVLTRTYAAAYPTLFRPLSSMPPDIRRHLRYPRTLLAVQARMFAAFHMTDPSVFYNKEDLWEIPSVGERSMEPYYLIMKLPGGQAEEFVLLLPFTPSKRDNLAAWMAVRCDGEHYGKVVVYTFPRDRLVFGPRQIDARIDQNAYISQQLTLWGQHGSQVIRGSLLIIPIERSLLYVQPLYLVATDRVGLPELRRVIVAYGNDVVMEENLEAAIQRLFTGSLPKPGAAEAGAPMITQTARELGRRALDDLRKAREALRKEDWAGFGRHLKDAEDALGEMGGLTSP
jgi:uncharacterized membrane protein (UPF0182 family)